MMKRIAVVIIVCQVCLFSYGQNKGPFVVSNGGEYYTNSQASISFTIGEVIVETVSNSVITLTQGFQQPSYVLTSIRESDQFDIQIHLFPNPVVNILSIKTTAANPGDLSYSLYDNSGRIISRQKFSSQLESLDMSDVSAGVYLLYIFSTSTSSHSVFKIQKLK